MASRTIVTRICDMSGVESDEVRRHTFALDGRQYEIDLSPDWHDHLVNRFEPFTDNARKVGTAGTNGKVRQSGPDPKVVREWARANGVAVSERGPIKAEVVEQWRAAS